MHNTNENRTAQRGASDSPTLSWTSASFAGGSGVDSERGAAGHVPLISEFEATVGRLIGRWKVVAWVPSSVN